MGATQGGPEKAQRPCFWTTRVREGTTKETREQGRAEEKEGGRDGNKSQLHRNRMTERQQQNKNKLSLVKGNKININSKKSDQERIQNKNCKLPVSEPKKETLL